MRLTPVSRLKRRHHCNVLQLPLAAKRLWHLPGRFLFACRIERLSALVDLAYKDLIVYHSKCSHRASYARYHHLKSLPKKSRRKRCASQNVVLTISFQGIPQ